MQIYAPPSKIIVPDRNLLLPVPRRPIAAIGTRMHGRYRLRVMRGDGTPRLTTDWFDNVITNTGLDNYGNRLNNFQYCHCGTGSTTPAFTDTGLTTWLASTYSQVGYPTASALSGSPYTASLQITYQFNAGVATGNISEVGVGPNSTNTGMFSHALILDGGGSPTTITVLSTEALQITYQLNNYPYLTDVGGSVTLSGTTYTTNMRAAYCGSSSSWSMLNGAAMDGAGASLSTVYSTQTLGAVTTVPSGTSAGGGFSGVGTYTNGNYYRDTPISFSLVQGNVAGGIGAALITLGQYSVSGQYQCSFSPVIPKDNSHVMTMILRHSWARN